MSLRLALLSFTVALTLAAPALAATTSREAAADAKRLAAARANAAAPVDTIKFLQPIDSYEVIGEHEILVWETNTKAWLVDLRPSAACKHLDRSYAIGLDSMYNTMNTNNSYVVGARNMRCKIVGIREVDVPGMRATERAPEAVASSVDEVASTD